MIEEILRLYRESDFDFRQFAYPEDPLRDRFEQWVPYYRLKFAIASVLQPKSILEIGVRYGYSAITFLSACPAATYLGLDNDSEAFGGVKDSISWAKKATQSYQADFLIADTQVISELTGEEYDLIHVDGQQDGAGTYHDLWIAINQAKFILLDGFMWTEENYRSACQFLKDRKSEIEYYSAIPGYAGELLIRVTERYRHVARMYRRSRSGARSSEIRRAYTADYYLDDCGGCEAYQETRGKEILDERLRAVFALASPRAGERFLDLGCGRGEIAYQAAKKGAQVTAVDYSPDAIQLAQRCFYGEDHLREKVDFVCASVTELTLDRPMDRVAAADVVEHLHPEELEQFLDKIAGALVPGGRLIIHTAPSLWYLLRGHASKRNRALAKGVFLPRDPNTAYEKLMHINEQSPAGLRRRLRAHFAHVIVWVTDGDGGDFAGSLAKSFNRQEYLEARGIFAVASNRSIETSELIDLLCQRPLKAQESIASIEILGKIKNIGSGVSFQVPVRITNRGPRSISSRPPNPVHLSYHWLAKDATGKDVWDGERSGLPFPILSGETVDTNVRIIAPDSSGSHRLQLSLVQEGVRWYEEASSALPVEVEIEVR